MYGSPGARPLTRYWPLLAGLGVSNLVIGLASMIWPGVTVTVLAVLFGLLLLFTGIAALGFGLRLRRASLPGGWAVVLGALSVLAAILVFIHPGSGARAIVLAVAFWFLLTGVGNVGLARRPGPHRAWSGLLGGLSVLAGIVLLVDNNAGVVTVSLLVGFGFLVRGFAELGLAVRMRTLEKALTVGP